MSEQAILEPQRLYDAAASAAFLQVSESTIYRYWKTGDLPCIRWGKRRRMTGDQLHGALQNGFGATAA